MVRSVRSLMSGSVTGTVTIVRDRFGNCDSYGILFRVAVIEGATVTPDWTENGTELFEWSGDNDGRD